MDEAETVKSLRRSISLTVALYFLIQCAIFAAYALAGGFLAAYWSRFLAASLSFHIVLVILLILFRNDFRKEPTGELLAGINAANRITLIRLSTLPTLLFLVMAAKEYRIRYSLLALVVFIFATDFLDGYISRKGKEITKIGRMMDSASDYALLVVLTIVFRYYDLIPRWFYFIVLARLGIQTLLMFVLIIIKRTVEPRTTIMGKVAVASIMVAYCVEMLAMISKPFPQAIKSAIEAIVAVILAASIGDKIASFASSLKDAKAVGRNGNGKDKERA